METTSRQSFYKILMDFTTKLRLPEGFTEKFNKFMPIVKLKIVSGATWDVRVEELEGEGCFFTTGWTEFCHDMELEMLEVLVFSYDGNSTFHVSVFAKTAAEKNSNFQVVKTPRFVVTFKNYHRAQVYLRWGFVEACGLTNKRKVRVEYAGGPSAEVELILVGKIGRGALCLGKGWNGFWKANSLTVGQTCSFEFIPRRNVIRVEPAELEEEIEYITMD